MKELNKYSKTLTQDPTQPAAQAMYYAIGFKEEDFAKAQVGIASMDNKAKLITVENNELLLDIARKALRDTRVEFVLADGYEWIQNYLGEKFDLIFADAMPGKYELFEETIGLVKEGGFYIIDDMLPQPNWPEGHPEKVEGFITELQRRNDILLTKLNWSTGIIIVTKIKLENNE